MILNIKNPDLYSSDVCPWCASDITKNESAFCYYILTCINTKCGKTITGLSNSFALEKIFYEEKEKGNHKEPIKGKNYI